MTSSKTTGPTIIIQPTSASDDFIGLQKEFTDALLDVFVHQLKLIHTMMVELPFAWTARDDQPPSLAMDEPPPAMDRAAAAPIAINLDAEDLLPATRKRKKPASSEAKLHQAAKQASGKTASKKAPRKGSAKGSAPTSLH